MMKTRNERIQNITIRVDRESVLARRLSSPIWRAALMVGGQSALARMLGVSTQAVTLWCATGVVPPQRVIPIERVTGGAVTRHELRPDIYPLEDGSDVN